MLQHLSRQKTAQKAATLSAGSVVPGLGAASGGAIAGLWNLFLIASHIATLE